VVKIKIPKEKKRYCPYCRKHTLHKVEIVKTAGRRNTSALKAGTRYRKKKLEKGYGSSPYPVLEHGRKHGAKTTRKVLLRFTCTVCGKKHQIKNAQRIKRAEIER